MKKKNNKKIKLSTLLIIAILISVSISIPIALYKSEQTRSEGELFFYRKNKTVKIISVKATETTEWIAEQNFIFKTSMPDTTAMLFLYEHETIYPFHMKKNHLQSDIIFVAPNNRIVIIEKNVATSTTQAPTYKTEVLYHYIIVANANFCDSHSINIDDSVSFKLNKK